MPVIATYSMLRRFASLALPALGLLACDSPAELTGPTPPFQKPVAYVEILAPAGELAVGQTVVLGTKLLAADGTVLSRPVAWTSSDTAVAGVTAGGVLTARAEGVAQITARSGEVDASVSVSVRRMETVVSIELEGPSSELHVGQSFAMVVRIRDQDGTLLYRPVQWSSSDTAVVMVTGSGWLTGRGPGEARITATAEGRQATAVVKVRAAVPATATALQPAAVQAGSPAFELTIRGTGFQPGAVVRWAGQERPARVISSTEVRVDITAADVRHPGAAEVQVLNPGQTLGARLYFTIEREAVVRTYDLLGLADSEAVLPVYIGAYFRNGDLREAVDQHVIGGVLRIHEDTYGPAQWDLTIRIVSTLRATGEVIRDENGVFFGGVEYLLPGPAAMVLRSDLFPNVWYRTDTLPNGDMIVHQSLHPSGDGAHERAWHYALR